MDNDSYRRATVTFPVEMRGAPSVLNISWGGSYSGSTGVQFNGNKTTTLFVNNVSNYMELTGAWFDAEL